MHSDLHEVTKKTSYCLNAVLIMNSTINIQVTLINKKRKHMLVLSLTGSSFQQNKNSGFAYLLHLFVNS